MEAVGLDDGDDGCATGEGGDSGETGESVNCCCSPALGCGLRSGSSGIGPHSSRTQRKTLLPE